MKIIQVTLPPCRAVAVHWRHEDDVMFWDEISLWALVEFENGVRRLVGMDFGDDMGSEPQLVEGCYFLGYVTGPLADEAVDGRIRRLRELFAPMINARRKQVEADLEDDAPDQELTPRGKR